MRAIEGGAEENDLGPLIVQGILPVDLADDLDPALIGDTGDRGSDFLLQPLGVCLHLLNR